MQLNQQTGRSVIITPPFSIRATHMPPPGTHPENAAALRKSETISPFTRPFEKRNRLSFVLDMRW